MSSSQLPKLFRHQAWADGLVLEGLRRTPGGPSRAQELLSHLVGVEHVWLSRIHGRPPQHAVWPELTLDACASLAADNAGAFAELLSDSTDDGLQREVDYRNSAGLAFRSTVEDILLQVALHGAYHRGQIALVVREAGGQPVPSDFIGFARGVPAATRRDTGSAAPPRAI